MNFFKESTFNRVLFTKLFLMACLFFLSGFPGAARAADVTLAWDAPSGMAFSGYKIYYDGDEDMDTYRGVDADQGDSPLIVYLEDLDDAEAPTYTLTGLKEEQHYYFAVTAFITDVVESDYSNEVGLITGDAEGPSTDSDGSEGPSTDSDGSGASSSTEGAVADATVSGDSGGGGCFITMASTHGAGTSVNPAALLLLGSTALLVARYLRRILARRSARKCPLP